MPIGKAYPENPYIGVSRVSNERNKKETCN
jgi:hypothetical protein